MNREQGFIQFIIVIVIALLVLGYYGFDLKDFINSPGVQKTLGYIFSFLSFVWNEFVSIIKSILN